MLGNEFAKDTGLELGQALAGNSTLTQLSINGEGV
jgi:hypothetical protein